MRNYMPADLVTCDKLNEFVGNKRLHKMDARHMTFFAMP